MAPELETCSKGTLLLLVLSMVLVACGQSGVGQEGTNETADPDVSGETADVVRESGELAEAVGEEIEQGATQVGTTIAETSEELAQAGEGLEQGAEQAGTAAARVGEEFQEESTGMLPQELTGVEAVTMSELDNNLDAYIGQTVGVRGDIVEMLGANAFQLSDPSALGGDEVLVVGNTIPTSAVSTGKTVEVAGVVHRFDLVTIENETGLDLQDELFADWGDNNAVLIAQDIIPIVDAGGP